MNLPKGATVAVVDGQTFHLFRNDGDEAGLTLSAVAHDEGDGHHKAGNAGRHSSSATPDGGQDAEDGFSQSVAEFLNKGVLEDRIAHLLVIAAPRTLGALRKAYHAKLTQALVGEIPKDLTGHTLGDIEKAVTAA